MNILAVIFLLLLAVPAQAKSIILIGDSIAGGFVFSTLPGKFSPYRPAFTIRELTKILPGGNQWKDATVYDWTVSGTQPKEWYFKPAKATECVGPNDPWDCCIGGSSGSGCICDDQSVGSVWYYYPHLRAACSSRTPILSHITQGADLALINTDGIVVTTVAAAVDDIEDLIAAVDAMSVSVLTSSPTYLSCPALSPCTLCNNHSDVRNEMNARLLITGPDFFTGKPAECGQDLIHARDSDYAGMGATWVSALP